MIKILIIYLIIIIIFYILNNFILIQNKNNEFFDNNNTINEIFYNSILSNFDINNTKNSIEYNNQKITSLRGQYIYYEITDMNNNKYIFMRYPDFRDEKLRHSKKNFMQYFNFLTNNFIQNNNNYIFDFVGYHGIIDNKVRLWIKLKEYYGRTTANSIMPKTYLIPTDYNIFIDEYDENKKYILKNSFGGARSALLITSSKNEILDHFNNNLDYNPYNCDDAVCHSNVKYNIIQEYIEPTFLMNGYKFGLRFFIVLIQDKNGIIKKLIYKDGYCYYSIKKYDSTLTNMDNNVVGSVFKTNNVIIENNFPFTFQEFIQYSIKNIENGNDKINNLINKLKYSMNMIINSNKDELFYFEKYRNIDKFSIFAFDVEFDNNFNPIIFEGNYYFARFNRNNNKYNIVLEELYNDIYNELNLNNKKNKGFYVI